VIYLDIFSYSNILFFIKFLKGGGKGKKGGRENRIPSPFIGEGLPCELCSVTPQGRGGDDVIVIF